MQYLCAREVANFIRLRQLITRVNANFFICVHFAVNNPQLTSVPGARKSSESWSLLLLISAIFALQ